MDERHNVNSADSQDMSWVSRLHGRFLVFDGPDGSGKTTQYIRFARACRAAEMTVCEVREPGGTETGERIRDILLDRELTCMSLHTEMLLYMASRAQLVRQHIRPALARGELVLADRFISSTLAYQGAAGGLPIGDIEIVADVVCGETRPDLVVIFDVDESITTARLGATLDRIEARGEEYFRRVRQGYLDQAKRDPARHLVIDASQPVDDVEKTLHERLRAWAMATSAEPANAQ